MKKQLLTALFSVVFAGAASAAENNKQEENLLEKPTGNPLVEIEQENKDAPAVGAKKRVAMWPACFAVFELPETPDLVGIRIAIPYSTKQESVTGLDIGLWGRCQNFEGLGLNIIRNDVHERFAGVQAGLYNSIGFGCLGGIQLGVWNEAHSLNGLQLGIVNLAGDAFGFQVGIINRSETMNGFQLGIINVIRDAEIPFCPVINVGF